MSTMRDRIWTLEADLAKAQHSSFDEALERRMVIRRALQSALDDGFAAGYREGMLDAGDARRAAGEALARVLAVDGSTAPEATP